MSRKIAALGFIVISLFIFSSCEVEPYEGSIPEQNNPENPGDPENPEDPENPGDPGSGGSYFPLAVGNSWTYTNSTSPDNEIIYDEGPIEISGTFSIDGVSYYEVPPLTPTDNPLEGTGFPSDMEYEMENQNGIHYENGEYSQWSEMSISASMQGMSVGMNVIIDDLLFLDENVEEGATWTSNVEMTTVTDVGGGPQEQTMTVPYNFEVLAKGVSATVGGETFEDVIKIGYSSEDFNSEMWFAKDVGPIHIYHEDTANGNWLQRDISSYSLN